MAGGALAGGRRPHLAAFAATVSEPAALGRIEGTRRPARSRRRSTRVSRTPPSSGRRPVRHCAADSPCRPPALATRRGPAQGLTATTVVLDEPVAGSIPSASRRPGAARATARRGHDHRRPIGPSRGARSTSWPWPGRGPGAVASSARALGGARGAARAGRGGAKDGPRRGRGARGEDPAPRRCPALVGLEASRRPAPAGADVLSLRGGRRSARVPDAGRRRRARRHGRAPGAVRLDGHRLRARRSPSPAPRDAASAARAGSGESHGLHCRPRAPCEACGDAVPPEPRRWRGLTVADAGTAAALDHLDGQLGKARDAAVVVLATGAGRPTRSVRRERQRLAPAAGAVRARPALSSGPERGSAADLPLTDAGAARREGHTLVVARGRAARAALSQAVGALAPLVISTGRALDADARAHLAHPGRRTRDRPRCCEDRRRPAL